MNTDILKNLAVEIPESKAENFLKIIIKGNKLKKDLQIFKENGFVYVPITDSIKEITYSQSIRDFREKKTNTIYQILRDFLNNEANKIGWQRIGNAVIFGSFFPQITDVSNRLVESNLASQVYLNTGTVSGSSRKPQHVLISGTASETTYKENGVEFVINPSKIMMSKGNIVERGNRLFKNVKTERILDMFSGIGYFSLPMSKNASVRRIDCIDINRDALHYLKKAANLNKVQDKIFCFEMDCRNYVCNNKYDLIIMGNFKSKCYLNAALGHARNGTMITLHHLEMSQNTINSPMEIMKSGRRLGYTLSLIDSHKVKSYSPHVWHLSSTFVVNY
jgi:tRNA wybutosine-synthesizing protein 2